MLAYQKDKTFHSLAFFKYNIWHKSDSFKLFLMLWFSLEKDTLKKMSRAYPQTSNPPQSPESWRTETQVFPEEPTPPAFVGKGQAEAQACETNIKQIHKKYTSFH